MVTSKRNGLQISDSKGKQVQKDKYLGRTLTEDGRCDTRFWRSIGAEKVAFQKLNNILRNVIFPLKTYKKSTENLCNISSPLC